MERYRYWLDTVLHLVRDSIIITDVSGRVVLISPPAQSLIGRDAKAVIGRGVDEVLAGVAAKTGRRWQELIAGGLEGATVAGATDCIFSVPNSTKQSRLTVTIASVPNDRGEIIGALLLFSHPSQDPKFQKALAVNVARYHQLIDLTQQGICITDKNAVISFVNPAMAKMLGYTPSEMVGREAFDFMNPVGVDPAKEALRRRKEGDREQYELELMHKEGRRIITTIEAAPIVDEDGNYAGSVAGVVDITQRKEAELAVRKSEATLRQAQRVAKIGSWWFDVKTREVVWTEEIFRIFGLPLHDKTIHYAFLRKIIHPEDWERFDSAVGRAEEKGIAYNLELRIVRPDGETRNLPHNTLK